MLNREYEKIARIFLQILYYCIVNAAGHSCFLLSRQQSARTFELLLNISLFSNSQSKKSNYIRKILCPQSPSILVPRPRRLRDEKRAMGTRMMHTKERNERGGNGDAPVTSSGLGKEGSNFWWARKRKRLLAVYRLLNSSSRF